jgi:hypothetical protein
VDSGSLGGNRPLHYLPFDGEKEENEEYLEAVQNND